MAIHEKQHQNATDGDLSRKASVRANSLKNAVAQDLNLTVLQAIRLYPKSILWSVIMSTALIMEGYDTVLLGACSPNRPSRNDMASQQAMGDTKSQLPGNLASRRRPTLVC